MSRPAERAARLERLLHYFGTLAAPRSDDQSEHHDISGSIANALFMETDLRWTRNATSYIADLTTNRLPALSRLSSIQTLHEGEQVLYGGWPWVSGTVTIGDAEQTICFPILEAPIDISPNVLDLGFRVRLVGPPAFSRLVANPTEELLDSLNGLEDLASGAHPERTQALWTILRAHLPGLAAITDVSWSDRNPTTLRKRPRMHLVPGGALYVRSGAAPGTRTHELLRTRTLDLQSTAVDHLYNGASGVVPEPRAVSDVGPMTEAQRRVVESALRAPVTVAAGPPGTGKTHVAVAAALAAVAAGDSVLIATTSRHAADVIANRFDIPGLRFFRFGAEDGPPALLTPKRVEGSDGGRHGDPAAIHTAIGRELDREAAIESALATRARSSQLGVVRTANVDPAKLTRWLRRASRQSLLGRWSRRRLTRALGLPRSTDHDTTAAAVEYVQAEDTIDAAMADGGVGLDGVWAELEGAVSASWERARVAAARASAPALQSQTQAMLDTALRAGPTQRRRKLAAMRPERITGAIPLWIGTLTEIGEYLPPAAGMFDLVIVDEASNTSQLEAAPALARARRVMILGDPRQLRHVSFVGDDRMQETATQVGLPDDLALLADIRRNSLFDVAAASAPTIWLDEHHRSSPHIIEFSATRFYPGLEVMTRHPRNETLDTIHTHHVPTGVFERGANPTEAERVMALVDQLDTQGATSIGIVSPFRAQADLIEARILEDLDADDIRRLRLRVGTVHGFQGSERNIMIITTALTPDHLTSLRFVNDPNLFNVMVTRARHQTHIVTSLTPTDLPDGLLTDYLHHAEQPPTPFYDTPADPGWTTDLFHALQTYGLRVIPEYPVGLHTIDLVVGEGDTAIGVETRVHPNGPHAHIQRHLTLRRSGWTLIDAYQSRWLTQPDAAAHHITNHALRRE